MNCYMTVKENDRYEKTRKKGIFTDCKRMFYEAETVRLPFLTEITPIINAFSHSTEARYLAFQNIRVTFALST
jgi:hypothetical protein